MDSITDSLNKLLGRAFSMDEGPGVKCDGVILQECIFNAYLVFRVIKNEIGTQIRITKEDLGIGNIGPQHRVSGHPDR